MNGFPYGPFHGTSVKEDVYQPDWTTGDRLAYTTGLIELMADIGPSGQPISLSTVPGTYKPLAKGKEGAMADRLLRAAMVRVAVPVKKKAAAATAEPSEAEEESA